MTGDLVELFVWMWIIATGAFAPLGYFIYKYTKRNAQPSIETERHDEAQSHGETQQRVETQPRVDKPSLVNKPSMVNDMSDSAMAFRSSAWKQSE